MYGFQYAVSIHATLSIELRHCALMDEAVGNSYAHHLLLHA